MSTHFSLTLLCSKIFFVLTTLIWGTLFFALVGCGQQLEPIQLSNVSSKRADALDARACINDADCNICNATSSCVNNSCTAPEDPYAYTCGAGIYAKNVNLTISNSRKFSEHFTSGKGGAIYAEGGSLDVGCAYPVNGYAPCTYEANTAGAGGVIYSQDNSSLSVEDIRLFANSAQDLGNAIVLAGNVESPQLRSNQFTDSRHPSYIHLRNFPAEARDFIAESAEDFSLSNGITMQDNRFHNTFGSDSAAMSCALRGLLVGEDSNTYEVNGSPNTTYADSCTN